MKEKNKENYKFIKVTNAMTGMSPARSLFVAETKEFGEILAITDKEWDIFASYHTHPSGMQAFPSSIDINKLFSSFPINFIYAPGIALNRFDYQKANKKYPKACWKLTEILDKEFFEDKSICKTHNKWVESENC